MLPDINFIRVFYRKDTLVGNIQTDPNTHCCVFEYDTAWVRDGFSLSPTELPLQKGIFHADPDLYGGAFAIFEDSIPDGYGLLLLDRILRNQGMTIKDLSPLQRLAIVGKSGMGALSYVPVMTGFQKHAEILGTGPLDAIQDEALAILSEKSTGDPGLLYYNSANSGGARPKAVMRLEDGSHWIVKFRHTYDSPDIGRNELLYMKTALECGINIPRIGLVKDKYFAIERFDIGADGKRIHTATAAALLKTDFRKCDVDYTNLLALTGYLTQDPAAVEETFRRMVFNIVAINKDDHSKNFTFLCMDGKWELAPAYDITYSPEGTRGEHATSVFYNGNPGIDLVLKAGTEIRIPEKRCMEIINRIESVCRKNLPKCNFLTPQL